MLMIFVLAEIDNDSFEIVATYSSGDIKHTLVTFVSKYPQSIERWKYYLQNALIKRLIQEHKVATLGETRYGNTCLK